MTPTNRLFALNELIDTFDRSISNTESELLDRLSSAAARLLESPIYLSTVLRDWKPQWVALIQDLVSGILTVSELNRRYFVALNIGADVLSEAGNDLLIAVGVSAAGVVVADGYIGTLLNDTSVGRKLISAITDAKLRKVSEPGIIARLKPLVKGKDGKGIIGKLFETLDTQPHVEADRVMQRSVAVRADLRASMYLGGTIDSTRPFCEARNGKVFLVEEIERFGTNKDTYGGYQDKAKGYFRGKTEPYDPFTQCGGRNCRHGWNYISNAEALRRRDDLEEVKGVLRIKKD